MQFRCLKVPLPHGVAMPKPEPPVKRFRYKPGKRERQERREQRAAAAKEWAARKAKKTRWPRPITVFGEQRSSSSRGDVAPPSPGQHELGEEDWEEEEEEEAESFETVLIEDEESAAVASDAMHISLDLPADLKQDEPTEATAMDTRLENEGKLRTSC